MFKFTHQLKFSFFVISVFCYTTISAQSTFKISGKVIDTTEKKVLENTNIVLLKATDSVLLASVRTDKEGKFVLPNVANGKYILMVSYPKYADYIDKLEINNRDEDLSTLPLVTTFFLLKEIVIKSAAAAIRIKGDTTEFTADSFKVTPNADV